MIRRSLATLAATAVAATGLIAVAPTASADPGSQFIATADCNLLRLTLRGVGFVNNDTTRSQLARKIRDEAKPFTVTDPATYLISAKYAGEIADRALECGIVKPDPQLFPGSSLPGLEDAQDIIQNLSSQLQR